ncbi:MAG: DUF222 domain-containing protein [Acidimicrobiaceae bacterium]|nr:DUF222 domain-containing protein [Acidimicrobiaceae bacterium]MYE97616.1 DUF222 domain-containing protein [Acidimicrobiaceae bacterium]MYH43437.1 DUF222 domain-containing protein [Acidimicrobiaceae bacterium]MYI53338.1 DUF222 domain-containing protein [Acidimicrobiaceae bacterium]MYJ81456.1 DUF222 domain-containing protein [Acidimicrobiaceae bacterium]
MESRIESVEAPGAECVVCAGDVEVSALSDDELVGRMAALGRQRCRLDAMLAETTAEMHRRSGGRAVSALMRERLHLSARQATAEVELAASLGELSATLDAWRAGEITAGHARVIARVASDPDHADEPALLEMARGYPVDMFARMTRHYMKPGVSSEERNRQHENRWASLVQDPDGSWRLSAYFDADDGKRVSLAFNAMVRTYRNDPTFYGSGPIQGLTSQQRRADALVNLITGEGPHHRPKTTLLVIADYDTVTRELKNLRYDDGLLVAVDQIAMLAAQAKILPAIFSAEGDPLWLGRADRHASAGQRIALAARDGGCVNCAAPAGGGEPHHIEWFSRGGPTDIDNLALLCERCHHLVHDDGWQLHSDNGRLRLQPPPQPTRSRSRSDADCRPGHNGHSDGRSWSDAPVGPQRNPVLRR